MRQRQSKVMQSERMWLKSVHVLGLPMTVQWCLSLSSIRHTWQCFSQTTLQHVACSIIACSAKQLHATQPCAGTPSKRTYTSGPSQSQSTFRDRLPISACLGPPPAQLSKATPMRATHCRRQENLQKVQCRALHKRGGGRMQFEARLVAPRLPR